MTTSPESLARTIAKARHGTDAMWANYMGAAEAARREVVEECVAVVQGMAREAGRHYTVDEGAVLTRLRALIAQPDGAQ